MLYLRQIIMAKEWQKRMEWKADAINQIAKGTKIFSENETVQYLCAVVKGKVTVQTAATKISFGPGNFFGAVGLTAGHYVADYYIEEDATLFAFSVKNRAQLRRFFEVNNKDYRGLVVSSLAKRFFELLQIAREYHAIAGCLYEVLREGYEEYKGYCRTAGMSPVLMPALEQQKAYADTDSVLPEMMESGEAKYYEELARVPADVQKNFFGCGTELTMQHAERIASGVSLLASEIKEIYAYIERYLPCLYSDGEQNLLLACIRLAHAMESGSGANAGLLKLVDKLLDSFNEMETKISSFAENRNSCDRKRLEKLYYALLSSSEMEPAEQREASEEELYREMKNSLDQIIEFSEIPASRLKEFTEGVNQFVNSKDRLSSEDSARQLRKKLAEGFYKLYRAVILKILSGEDEYSKAVELFLNFGYLDERFLTKEQVLELCRVELTSKAEYCCTVFTIPEWLRAVYHGERQPSKNEFDLEYAEMLREQKKNGEIDEEEEQKRLKDPLQRLEYEIQNVFRYNHRILSGQPSVFVPMLISEQMANGPLRAAVTKDRIGQLVGKYRDIDYSVFYRELSYADAAAKIEKEFEMREVAPDIILFPVYGQKSIMWQEISCKRRDSAARFLFPVLMDGNPEDELIRCFGRFRWELCRTMQGSAWNNIQHKSLTSEYSDYIQFYRKNKDLSEERKERLKAQIQKGKNNTREIFVLDYELWLKSEAMGGVRLNKVARDILAMYCPFKKEIRNALESQPSFADSIARFHRESAKKLREIELRYHALQKKGIVLTKPLKDTESFYRDK